MSTILVKTDRSESRKKRIRVLFIVLFLLLLVIGFFAYLYYWSPLFGVKDFLVYGTTETKEAKDAIMRYAALSDSFLSPKNDRIFYWVSRDGEMTSPSFLPSALSIDLKTDVEKRTVTVQVVGRVMNGVWCSMGNCFVFDGNGILFAESPDVSGSLILKIRDENNEPVSLGTSVLTREEFESIKHAIESIQKNNIPISEIVIQNRELREWATVAPNGFSVRFSFDSMPDDLDSVFQGVFERTKLEKLTYIDLRVPNRVYFK